MKTKGGMTAVLVSYNQYIEKMRFIPTWKLGNKLVKAWYALQAYVRTSVLLAFDKRIKIVHIHGAANASFDRCRMFIRLAKRFGKKVILHEHAADFVEYYKGATDSQIIRETLCQCDALIVLSQSWRKFFASLGVDESRIHVLNNIVSPPSLDSTNHAKDGKLHLMYMGEISKRKGGFDLLQAVADHKEYLRDKLVLRMGGNEVDGDIKAFIKEHGLESFVSYEGWIAGQKKVDCLNWEDVYVLPSYNEGLPIAILEAMAYSHPIISTPVGGIPEVVKDGVNGTLVAPGDKDAIAAAIRKYIESPQTIAYEGNNAYETVKDFFPERVFADLMNIYQKVNDVNS
jgi:glycosyltransferase involved in cell wall biosynthesis